MAFCSASTLGESECFHVPLIQALSSRLELGRGSLKDLVIADLTQVGFENIKFPSAKSGQLSNAISEIKL